MHMVAPGSQTGTTLLPSDQTPDRSKLGADQGAIRLRASALKAYALLWASEPTVDPTYRQGMNNTRMGPLRP